jgi:ER lumen protein retaining receptor
MSMNPFRFCGDMSHLFSIIVLLLRLRVAKNAQGES